MYLARLTEHLGIDSILVFYGSTKIHKDPIDAG